MHDLRTGEKKKKKEKEKKKVGTTTFCSEVKVNKKVVHKYKEAPISVSSQVTKQLKNKTPHKKMELQPFFIKHEYKQYQHKPRKVAGVSFFAKNSQISRSTSSVYTLCKKHTFFFILTYKVVSILVYS